MLQNENPTIGPEIASDGQSVVSASAAGGEAATEPSAATAAKSGGGFMGSLGSVLFFVIGYNVMKVVPMHVLVMLLAGLAAGFGTGLIPFFVARARRQASLGGWALAVCTVLGTAFGLLGAGPAAVIFTIVAVARGRAQVLAPATADIDNAK